MIPPGLHEASLSLNNRGITAQSDSPVQTEISPCVSIVPHNVTSVTEVSVSQRFERTPETVSTEREDAFTFKSAKQSSSSSSLRGRSAHTSGRIEVSENFVAMNLKKKKIRTLRGGKRSGKYHGGNGRGGFSTFTRRSKPLGLQVDDAQGIGTGRSKYSINKSMDDGEEEDDDDDNNNNEEQDDGDDLDITGVNDRSDGVIDEDMEAHKTHLEQPPPLPLPVSGLTMSQADMQAEVEAELRMAAIVAARSFVPLGATDAQAAARLGGFNNGRSSFSYVSAAASATGGGVGGGGGAIDGGAGRTAKVDGGDVLEACLDALDTSRPSAIKSAKSLSSRALPLKQKSNMDDRSDRGRPLCSGHQLECAMRKVKKEGPNKGRWFYSCPADKDAQCGFFCWKDADSRAAVTRFLEAASEAALAEAAALSSSTDPSGLSAAA